MQFTPTPDQEAFIRQAIASGRYRTPEDALRDAMAGWEELSNRARRDMLLIWRDIATQRACHMAHQTVGDASSLLRYSTTSTRYSSITGFDNTSCAIRSSYSSAFSRPALSSIVKSKYFPCRTSVTDGCPWLFNARRIVCPCGSSTVGLRMTKTRAFMRITIVSSAAMPYARSLVEGSHP